MVFINRKSLTMNTGQQILGFFVILLLTYSAAAIGGFATGNSVLTWYPELIKPDWNPPAWLFGPVWSALYTMMAVAAFLVWRKGMNTFGVEISMILYVVQLVLNALWSICFFGLKMPGLALFEIIFLEIAIILTFINFKRVTPISGWLLVPYILWVAFATFLNGTIWYLNKV